MKLPYRPYRVRLYQVEPYVTVWRPTVRLILYGPLGSVKLNALVDPGADQAMLPREFAEALGIAVDDGRPGSVCGVSVSPLLVYPGAAKLEIDYQGESLCWPAAIRFSPVNHVLLGQLGCLEFFTATFDYDRRLLTLEPNETYPVLAQ